MSIKAAAAAEHDRVALDLIWLQIMPDIMDKIADALADSNITVFNGADGLEQFMSGLVTQALTIYTNARAQTLNNNQVDDELLAAPTPKTDTKAENAAEQR